MKDLADVSAAVTNKESSHMNSPEIDVLKQKPDAATFQCPDQRAAARANAQKATPAEPTHRDSANLQQLAQHEKE